MNIRFKKSYLTFNIMLMYVFLFCYIICYAFFKSSNFNLVNFTIFILSSFIVSVSLYSIEKKGINAYNLFFFVFFFFLMLNTYNISNLQKEKTLMDLYYYFVGPLVFGGCIFIFENINFLKEYNWRKIRLFNPNKLVLGALIVYIICYIYIYSITGIRLFGGEMLSTDSQQYVVPGVSGVVALLFWVLLIYVPHINRSMQISVVASVILFQGILNSKRGELVRILLFLGIYYMLKRGKKLFNRKIITRLLIMILGLILIFTITGEYRQSLRMGDSGINFSMNDLSRSNIENKAINWLYTYTALNFDVLSVSIMQEPKNSMEAISIPIKRIMGGSSAVENYYDQLNSEGLSGFNATTFLFGYIRDLGVLYVFEIIFLGIFVGFVIALSKKHNFVGLYTYILLLTLLTIFGDYYFNPSNFFCIIITFVVLSFTKLESANKSGENLRVQIDSCN